MRLATLLRRVNIKFFIKVFNKIILFFVLVIACVKVGKNSDYDEVRCPSSCGSDKFNDKERIRLPLLH